jgi:hypothetical protein
MRRMYYTRNGPLYLHIIEDLCIEIWTLSTGKSDSFGGRIVLHAYAKPDRGAWAAKAGLKAAEILRACPTKDFLCPATHSPLLDPP